MIYNKDNIKMIIKINDKESYAIQLKDRYDLDELKELINRFTKIVGLNKLDDEIDNDIKERIKTPFNRVVNPNTGKIKKVMVDTKNNNKKRSVDNIKCPYCGSDKISRHGVSLTGARKLRCISCKRYFYPFNPEVKVSEKTNKLHWNKDIVIESLKIHFTNNNSDLCEKFMNKIKKEFSLPESYDWSTITKAFPALKKRYDIKPEEVGIKYFPNLMGASRAEKRNLLEEIQLR